MIPTFEHLFVLLTEAKDGALRLATSQKGETLVAREGNQQYLREIGDKLIVDGYIDGYQLLTCAEPPIRTPGSQPLM